MGTPDFAVPSLRALARSHDVLSVYTQPDRPAGRGRTPRPSAVRMAADELGLPVRQVSRLEVRDVADMRADTPDVICVAAFGQILPPAVLEVPPHGAINVHASLLPRHRGAAPVARSILEGDETTGVSIMQMEAGLDTGPVALAVSVPVGEHTSASLAQELSEVGAAALVEVLELVASGTATWEPQDESQATYAGKISAADVALSPDLEVAVALRRIRASSRHAPSRASLCGSTAVIVEAEAARGVDLPPAALGVGGELLLGLADGAIRVLALRPESRAQMSGNAFVCGLREPDPTWESVS